MNIALDPVEARVIGSLMEKSLITPEQYPLSLNALVSACNQKSSREPVMSLGEGEVQAALERLMRRYLVREKAGFGARVPKYHYRLYNDEIGDFRFSEAERALVALLLLRGPQTPGELRSRAQRMHAFRDVEAVEATLEALMGYQQGPFVTRLPREPGRREVRYAELFSGEAPTARAEPLGATTAEAAAGPADERAGAPAAASSSREPAGEPVAPGSGPQRALEDRLTRLESRVAALEATLAALLEERPARP
jgi:hypothetical protein